MNHVSLFTGIGGADLAAEWAGIETIAQSEIDPYCCRVLAKNFAGVPNLGDIRNITKEVFENETGCKTVDIISGGFPCQPYSFAGKRRGKADDRALWDEMFRVICELRPAWIIGENVAGFISMGIDDALSNLKAQGYTCRAFVLPACASGAYHRRDRVFIVANLMRGRYLQSKAQKHSAKRGKRTLPGHSDCNKADDSDTYLKRMERLSKGQVSGKHELPSRQGIELFSQVEQRFNTDQPRLCGSLHGIPDGVDRIKSLGNAIVPQQIYPIFAAIAEIERSKDASTD